MVAQRFLAVAPEWTDDTAMAIGILDAIAEKECQIEAIGNNFPAGMPVPPDVGIQTSAVLSSPQMVVI